MAQGPVQLPRSNEDSESFEKDLHPNPEAGYNTGQPLPEGIQTAYDIRDIHRGLPGFTDDELKQVPILPQGTRLKQGATYIDLIAPERLEFKATADMEAGPVNAYVPKSEVPYQIFNRLIGVDNPERTGEGDDSSVRP